MTTQLIVIEIEGDNPAFAEEARAKAVARIDALRPGPPIVVVSKVQRRRWLCMNLAITGNPPFWPGTIYAMTGDTLIRLVVAIGVVIVVVLVVEWLLGHA